MVVGFKTVIKLYKKGFHTTIYQVERGSFSWVKLSKKFQLLSQTKTVVAAIEDFFLLFLISLLFHLTY